MPPFRTSLPISPQRMSFPPSPITVSAPAFAAITSGPAVPRSVSFSSVPTIVAVTPPQGTHSNSVGAAEFGRGVGVPSERSAALEFVSSAASSPFAHPRAWVRASERPSGIAGASGPAPGNGSEAPVNVPQPTQSGGVASAKQTAPPDGLQRRGEPGEGEVRRHAARADQDRALVPAVRRLGVRSNDCLTPSGL